MGTQLPLYSPVAAGSIWRNKQENVMAEPLSGAPFTKIQGPWTLIQVTVSKRLTFWNRSLCFHGVGKVSGIFLQSQRHVLLLACYSFRSSVPLSQAEDRGLSSYKIGIQGCLISRPLAALARRFSSLSLVNFP